jgi:hypothetical protein
MDAGQTLLVTRAELARRLGVSAKTLWSYVRKGLIPGMLKGTHRFSRPAVVARLRGSETHITAALCPFDQWKASRATASP